MQIHSFATDNINYVDSVFKVIPKEHRIKKLLFQPLSNFDNKSDLNHLETMLHDHNLGGVILRNGDLEYVKNWIAKIKKQHKFQPLFILSIPQLLSFPLRGVPLLPDVEQIERISNDSIVTQLGRNVGEIIKSTGFDMVMLDPSETDPSLEFKSKSKIWISNYLKGLSQSGIQIVFGQMNVIPFANHQFLFSEINKNLKISGLLADKVSNVEEHYFDKKSRKSAEFNGLIFGKARSFTNKDSFFENGHDAIVLPNDLNNSIDLVNYFSEGKRLKNKGLNLRFKRRVKLQKQLKSKHSKAINLNKVRKTLSQISHEVFRGSVACLKNENEVLPFKNLDQSHFASISAGTKNDQIFRTYLDKYTLTAHYDFDYVFSDSQKALSVLSHFDKIIVNVDINYDNDERLLDFLNKLNLDSKIIVTYSGKGKNLKKWLKFNALISIPKYTQDYTRILPQNLFGAIGVDGVFPYEISQDYALDEPLVLKKNDRLSYYFKETKRINTNILMQIEMVIRDAIQTQTMPGCQTMMIKDGVVIYEKSFGHFTYDSLLKIEDHSIYDIASLTKVIATVPAIMFLNEKEKILIDDGIANYLPAYENTDKAQVSIKNLLRHQSGLRSYFPFWKRAEKGKGGDFRYKLPKRKRAYYKNKDLKINWNDSIQYWIVNSDYNSLRKPDGSYGYLYSDLGFMLLKDLAQLQLNQPMGVFLDQNIYAPLGMTSTTYEPLCNFPLDQIAPTEEDNYFRNSLIWGQVHDQNAALTKGADGHAGLFSNASDLGKYLQMYLQGGVYGGQRYFEAETIAAFTTKESDSKRRALGWDKPERSIGNVSKYASNDSYGHTGFTGTMVWVDPKYDFIFVFLSNRVYPDAKNNKLSENNIRTKIQDIMYESFLKPKFE